MPRGWKCLFRQSDLSCIQSEVTLVAPNQPDQMSNAARIIARGNAAKLLLTETTRRMARTGAGRKSKVDNGRRPRAAPMHCCITEVKFLQSHHGQIVGVEKVNL